jgi:hypothetical protein
VVVLPRAGHEPQRLEMREAVRQPQTDGEQFGDENVGLGSILGMEGAAVLAETGR